MCLTQEFQGDGFDGILTAQIGEQRAQRAILLQFVLAAGANDGDRIAIGAASQVGKQLTATAIRPL
ncbi:hypothetical protein [Dictyobacter kobayashii]|nr:hypothetical protein [Dictyobacter kobayashii]